MPGPRWGEFLTRGGCESSEPSKDLQGLPVESRRSRQAGSLRYDMRCSPARAVGIRRYLPVSAPMGWFHSDALPPRAPCTRAGPAFFRRSPVWSSQSAAFAPRGIPSPNYPGNGLRKALPDRLHWVADARPGGLSGKPGWTDGVGALRGLLFRAHVLDRPELKCRPGRHRRVSRSCGSASGPRLLQASGADEREPGRTQTCEVSSCQPELRHPVKSGL